MKPEVIIKYIFAGLLVVNVFIILFCNYTLFHKENITLVQIQSSLDNSNNFVIDDESSETEGYHFKDPVLAHQILERLHVFYPFYGEHSREYALEQYERPFRGYSKDKDYCKKHIADFAHHPNYIFTEKNILSTYRSNTQIRKLAVRGFGTDVMEAVVKKSKEHKRSFDIILSTRIQVFMTGLDMYIYRHIDQQYSCLGQMSNHVPGHSSLYRKDYAAHSVNQYAKEYVNRPECFNFNKFFPKTFLLYEEEDCKEFFRTINSKEYQELKEERGIVYMRKKGSGSHAGKGIFPVNQTEEDYIRNMYKNGESCGKVRDNNIMQTFIHNPLLIKGKKFDFRMYFLIASVNPLIAYYHDGCLRVSLMDYNVKEGNKSNLLTNTAMNKHAFKRAKKEGTYMGKTEEELKEEHSWSFSRFQEYLLEAGIIKDPNWLDNYLRPQFKEAMIHLVRMAQHTFYKQSTLYELYGLDFMLDENMDLWFIEGNVRPFLEGHTPDNIKLKVNMVKDHFEIVFGVLRSRMKRVFNYVNNMILNNEAELDSDGFLEIQDLNEKQQEFKELIKNFIEPEFEPRKENGFSKIVDENYTGTKRYMGYLREECF